MKRYALLRRAWEVRVVGCVGLAIGVPTLGVAFTALVPLVFMTSWNTVAPGSSRWAGWLAAPLWLISMAALAFATLFVARRTANARLRNGTLVIGADGVALRGFFFLRFHPWSRIRHVRRTDRTVELDLAGGHKLKLTLSDAEEMERAARFTHRHYTKTLPTRRLRVLECESQPDAAWIQRVRLAAEAPAYREEAVTTASLTQVALDPTQTPVQRVGAILALGTMPEKLAARLRVAADDCANWDLAEAMSTALDGDVDLVALRRAARRQALD